MPKILHTDLFCVNRKLLSVIKLFLSKQGVGKAIAILITTSFNNTEKVIKIIKAIKYLATSRPLSNILQHMMSGGTIPGYKVVVGRSSRAWADDLEAAEALKITAPELLKLGAHVIYEKMYDVHVSGHACREEIKLLMALLRPEYFMPVHGEFRHLYANKDIAEFMGIPSENIFVSEIGRVLEIDKRSAGFLGSIPAGKVLVDGAGVGDIGSVVLRDRKHLSEDGLVVVVATADLRDRYIVSGPDIVSRGFVYVKESEDLMDELRIVAAHAIDRYLSGNRRD